MAFYLGSNQVDNSNISYYIGSNFYNEENLFLQRQITQFSSNISIIGSYAFYRCTSLTSIDLPQATTIGNNTFYGCGSLTSVNLPQATSIGENAFYSCNALTSINLPLVSVIGNSAFYNCYSLASISLPQVTTIGSSAFYNCRSLASVNLPQATTIEDYAFYYCTSLTSINLPQVTTIGNYAFGTCYSLTSINLPQATTIGSWGFYYCTSLASINLSQVISIGTCAFRNCYNLLSLYLLGSSIPILASTNAFASTPISDYTTSTGGVYGSIYVSPSLYSSYLTATNWSVYSARIVGRGTIKIYDSGDTYYEEYTYDAWMTWEDWVNSSYNTAGFIVQNELLYRQDSVSGNYVPLEDSNLGETMFARDMVVDYASDTYLLRAGYFSRSGFRITDDSYDSLEFIYDIDMTWADWISSSYNTVGLTIDTNNSYVGKWDSTNNTYVYLVDMDNTSNIVISTHKIREDIEDKTNDMFYINIGLSTQAS